MCTRDPWSIGRPFVVDLPGLWKCWNIRAKTALKHPPLSHHIFVTKSATTFAPPGRPILRRLSPTISCVWHWLEKQCDVSVTPAKYHRICGIPCPHRVRSLRTTDDLKSHRKRRHVMETQASGKGSIIHHFVFLWSTPK